MNKRLTKLIVSVVAGLMIGGESVSRGHSPLPDKSLNVSKYGTLLEIYNANGKSRFGKLAGEGFQLSYEIQGKTNTVSAVGDAEAVGLIAIGVKTDGRSATVINRTSDQALEITTYFHVNEKTNRFIIQRRFRNISKEPVAVKTMLEYIDPALVIDVGSNLKEIGEKAVAVLRGKLKAAINEDCQPGECPEDPPPCPLPCGARIRFDVDRMTIRTNPATGTPDSMILNGDAAFTLSPQTEAVTSLFAASPPIDIG